MNSTDTAKIGIMITLIVFITVCMFVINNRVQTLESELKTINASIQEDIKSIHVLKAEWSHLNSPQRLRTLASKHISLNPARAEQIINYSELPFEHENRRLIAQKNINRQATRNKELRRLVKAQR